MCVCVCVCVCVHVFACGHVCVRSCVCARSPLTSPSTRSIRQHTSADVIHVSTRQQTSAYVSIHQHTQHTSACCSACARLRSLVKSVAVAAANIIYIHTFIYRYSPLFMYRQIYMYMSKSALTTRRRSMLHIRVCAFANIAGRSEARGRH